jgi:hypothetical protein
MSIQNQVAARTFAELPKERQRGLVYLDLQYSSAVKEVSQVFHKR